MRRNLVKTLYSHTRSTLCCGLFVLVMCIAPPGVGAVTTWQALVVAQSRDLGIQALAFLPNEFWIHEGDSIRWAFDTDEIHTVTFLKHVTTPQQVRPAFAVGCPGTTPDESSFNGSTCVNSGTLASPQTYTVTFPTAGNFKLVCLVHANQTGTVHVLAPAEPLPYNQTFYDRQAQVERVQLLADGARLQGRGTAVAQYSSGDAVTAGIGAVVATGGGFHTVSIMRFQRDTIVVRVGDTVEWTNWDPATPHTVTFGDEPANPMALVGLNANPDADGARHAVLTPLNATINSGFLAASPQDRVGLPQAPVTVTRFRVTFTTPGVFNYICALHDDLGMAGRVVVHR